MCCEISGVQRFSWHLTTAPCIALTPSYRGMTTKIQRKGSSMASIQKAPTGGAIWELTRAVVLVRTQQVRRLRAARLELCMLQEYQGLDVQRRDVVWPTLWQTAPYYCRCSTRLSREFSTRKRDSACSAVTIRQLTARILAELGRIGAVWLLFRTVQRLGRRNSGPGMAMPQSRRRSRKRVR